MKKRAIVSILMIILLGLGILFTGCSSKSESAQPAPAAEPSKGSFDKVIDSNSELMPPAASPQAVNRKLIVKLFMQMRVDDIEKSISDAEAMAATVGGYTRESYLNESSGQVTLMVPAGKTDTFIDSIRKLGKVTNSNRNTEDVTDSYFDTQVRIKNLEAQIETMRNLLQKPGWKVSEILEIEREIRRLTDELETLKGYITNLDRQVTYSEVRISFDKSQIAIDSMDQESLGYKLKLALKGGVDLLIGIVTAILRLVAFLLPIAPVAIILYFVLRKPIRKLSKKDKQEPKP